MGPNDSSDGITGLAGDKSELAKNSTTVNLESGQVHEEINGKSNVVDVEVAKTANKTESVKITMDCETAERTEAVEIAVDRETAERTGAVEITVDRETAERTETVEITVERQTVEQTKANNECKNGNDEQDDRKSNSDRSNERPPNEDSDAHCSTGKVDDAENLQENTKTERNSSFSELTTIAINDNKSADKTKKKQSANWQKFKCYFLLFLMFLLALWVVLYFSFITGYPIPFVKKTLESWGFKV